MEAGQPDVVNQLPATGNPMEPTSGTYGKVAELDRLKQQLDLPGGGNAPGGERPTGLPTPGMPQGSQMSNESPGGLPSVLMAPTSQPEVPPSTPLGPQVQQQQQQQSVEAHIAALEALLASPTTSQATKQWAETVLARYRS